MDPGRRLPNTHTTDAGPQAEGARGGGGGVAPELVLAARARGAAIISSLSCSRAEDWPAGSAARPRQLRAAFRNRVREPGPRGAAGDRRAGEHLSVSRGGAAGGAGGSKPPTLYGDAVDSPR